MGHLSELEHVIDENPDLPPKRGGLPDHFGLGVLLGLLCAVLGFWGFGQYWRLANDTDFYYFVDKVFLGTDIYQTKIITVSMVPIVIGFYLCQRVEKYRLCGGMMMVLVAGAIVAAVLW